MGRLCERPGCSDPASVAYGMRAEDLVFWLDVSRPGDDQAGGVLCRRHADSMVVPRHWTLDDLRDPDLRLFRPPTPLPPPVVATRRRPARAARSAGEQLHLGDDAVSGPAEPAGSVADADAVGPDSGARADTATEPDPVCGDEEAPAAPWTPTFDEQDDLDGLLSARSPLLARAFRGDDRPRSK